MREELASSCIETIVGHCCVGRTASRGDCGRRGRRRPEVEDLAAADVDTAALGAPAAQAFADLFLGGRSAVVSSASPAQI